MDIYYIYTVPNAPSMTTLASISTNENDFDVDVSYSAWGWSGTLEKTCPSVLMSSEIFFDRNPVSDITIHYTQELYNYA